jgi:hypothetical protein
MIMKFAGVFLFTAIMLFSGCGQDDGDENGVVLPANLVVNVAVAADKSGKIDVTASADNANYYMISFGEITGETPVKSTTGTATYTYQKSGSYTITVYAHATEIERIFTTKLVNVTVGEATNLAWEEEFDGTSLNTDFWTFETGAGGWGNNELQYYRPENTSVSGGFLTITAKQESFSGSNYTSSRLITKGKKEFQYGTIEIRAKLPKGQGIWPALWMLGGNISSVGWPKCGEIDIMEMIGGANNRDKTVYGTLHWDEGGNHACTCDKPGYTLPSGIFNDDFHVFKITWDQTDIKWFVDGTQFNQINITPSGLSEFHAKHFFIVNLAVGGNWPGSPDGTTTFPQQLIVDYIRVYQ